MTMKCWNCGTEIAIDVQDGFRCPNCNVDITEEQRRVAKNQINLQAAITTAVAEECDLSPEELARQRLVDQYGEVWSTKELTEVFTPLSFMAPYLVVQRKSDGKKGTVMFQHSPRFYFNFEED